MAIIQLPTLRYVPAGPKGLNWVAQFNVTPGDTSQVDLRTAVSDNSRAIDPNWLAVDNSRNEGYCVVAFPTYQVTILPYQREVIEILDGVNTVAITPQAPTVGLTLVQVSEQRLQADQSNNLLIQQTALTTLQFPFVTYTGSVAQNVPDDNNHVVQFIPATPMNYTLASPAAAGNGWISYLRNDSTIIGPVTIATVTLALPLGVSLICEGGIFTQALPFRLYPGESGILHCDGSTWYLELTGQSSPCLWTPQWFWGANQAIAYSARIAQFVRRGKMLAVMGQISVTNGGAPAAGDAPTLRNLPFATPSATLAPGVSLGCLTVQAGSNMKYSSSSPDLIFDLNNTNSTIARLVSLTSSFATGLPTYSNFSAATMVVGFVGEYETCWPT